MRQDEVAFRIIARYYIQRRRCKQHLTRQWPKEAFAPLSLAYIVDSCRAQNISLSSCKSRGYVLRTADPYTLYGAIRAAAAVPILTRKEKKKKKKKGRRRSRSTHACYYYCYYYYYYYHDAAQCVLRAWCHRTNIHGVSQFSCPRQRTRRWRCKRFSKRQPKRPDSKSLPGWYWPCLERSSHISHFNLRRPKKTRMHPSLVTCNMFQVIPTLNPTCA
jgi:hypothetical protein